MDRLPAALRSLAQHGVAALVVANECLDATAAAARAAGAAVLELPVLPGGVGAARRAGMSAVRRIAPGATALLTTDAVFGRIVPEPDEFAHLPAPVRRHGNLEDLRDALMAEIGGRAAPQPWDPLPRHGQSPGALIAFRPDIYDAIGGFEPLPCREDRLIERRLVECGFRVARPWDAVVFAWCRLRGRAPDGMADTIADRTRADLARATDRLERQTGFQLPTEGQSGAYCPARSSWS